jgi:ketosteroid isomerase-like protein
MKPIRLVFVVIVIALFGSMWMGGARAGAAPPLSGSAVENPTAPATKNIEVAITQLERDWAKAIVSRDAPALERLLAEDFNGTSPTAYTFPKSVAVNDLKTGKYRVDSMVLDEISVNVYGEVAIAFTSQQEQSAYNGKDTSGHYHFTDVWVKRGNIWQVVASHGSRFDE